MDTGYVSMWRRANGRVHIDPPSWEAIAALAYSKFVQRQPGAPGDALRDWLDAERELRDRAGRLDQT
jgi:hypothetical protein